MTPWAERLHSLMTAAGKTQADLARACRIKPGSVSGWFDKGKPTKMLAGDNLVAVAALVESTAEYIITGKAANPYETHVHEPAHELGAWIAYNEADSKTRAVVDLLLLPSRERAAAVKGNKSLELAINVLEAEVVNARKSPNAATAAAGVV